MAIDDFMTSVYSLETTLNNYSKHTNSQWYGDTSSSLISPPLALLVGVKFIL